MDCAPGVGQIGIVVFGRLLPLPADYSRRLEVGG